MWKKKRKVYDINKRSLPSEYIEPWWAPDCPSEPKVIPSSRDERYLWEGQSLDVDLKVEWMDELNAIPGIEIVHTNVGHLLNEGSPNPEVGFVLPEYLTPGRSDEVVERIRMALEDIADTYATDYGAYPRRIGVMVESYIPRVWMSECQAIRWWEELITRLAEWVALDLKIGQVNEDALCEGPYRVCIYSVKVGMTAIVANAEAGTWLGVGASVPFEHLVDIRTSCHLGTFTDARDFLISGLREANVDPAPLRCSEIGSADEVLTLLSDSFPLAEGSTRAGYRKKLLPHLFKCFRKPNT